MRIAGETLLGAYGGRIVNIHPSLLPAFRGAHAIEQALEYGVKVFGVTVHWVDATLDGGRIIAQRAFGYEGGDAGGAGGDDSCGGIPALYRYDPKTAGG